MIRETRWRVTTNVIATALAGTLNKLQAQGWTIYQVTQASGFRFTVILSRKVRVRE